MRARASPSARLGSGDSTISVSPSDSRPTGRRRRRIWRFTSGIAAAYESRTAELDFDPVNASSGQSRPLNRRRRRVRSSPVTGVRPTRRRAPGAHRPHQPLGVERSPVGRDRQGVGLVDRPGQVLLGIVGGADAIEPVGLLVARTVAVDAAPDRGRQLHAGQPRHPPDGPASGDRGPEHGFGIRRLSGSGGRPPSDLDGDVTPVQHRRRRDPLRRLVAPARLGELRSARQLGCDQQACSSGPGPRRGRRGRPPGSRGGSAAHRSSWPR